MCIVCVLDSHLCTNNTLETVFGLQVPVAKVLKYAVPRFFFVQTVWSILYTFWHIMIPSDNR